MTTPHGTNLNPTGGGDDHNRLMELLADQATVGLTPVERAELDTMLIRAGHVDSESLDLAAAALACGLVAREAKTVEVPRSLLGRLSEQAVSTLAAAREQVSEQRAGSNAMNVSVRRNVVTASTVGSDRTTPSASAFPPVSSGAGWRIWGGWLAAAACLTLAAILWTRPGTGTSNSPSFSALVAAPGTISRDWGYWPEKPAGEGGEVIECAKSVTGKVYWNQQLQTGYMVFKGLPANDPKHSQYQLWILDKTQKHPIDGGVFDTIAANSAGEVVVPITSKLDVKDLVGFGITEESSGGVVVSDQNRRIVVALLGS